MNRDKIIKKVMAKLVKPSDKKYVGKVFNENQINFLRGLDYLSQREITLVLEDRLSLDKTGITPQDHDKLSDLG